MKFSLRRVGPATALLCELIGLTALALTPDVERPLFLVPMIVGALALLTRFSLPDRILLLLVALLVAGGYITSGSQPTGTLMARALIPAHALLWLAAEERVYRFWRLGVALIELVLSAILSPEAHMFVLIFFFVLLSSLALSLGFIERRFAARDREALERPIRGSFVGSVLALSCVIFLSSLLIFPLLPRSRWNGNGNETTSGYNDVVNYQQGILHWGVPDAHPVLWVFRASGQSWLSMFPNLLIRGQALDRFDGQIWKAQPGHYVASVQPVKSEGTVEMLRQPLPTDVLPVPYGAFLVENESDYDLDRMGAGEWIAHGARTHSVRYKVQYGGFRTDEFGGAPGEVDSAVDPKLFPGTVQLGARLAREAKSADERIAGVMRFFRDGGFASELRSVPPYKPGMTHPIETFLFQEKRGHCELFAASAALLLRSMGIPARLVVGFRARPPAYGNVLTVRASDAHAWVEAWTPGRGWRAIDLTPVAYDSGWMSDLIDESTDWIGAYWNRYILEYEFDPEALLKVARRLAPYVPVLLLLVGLAAWSRRRYIRWRPVSDRDRLARILDRFEDDLIHRAGMFPDQAYRQIAEATEWRRRYAELRFGRVEPTPADVKQLRRQAKKLLVKASRAAQFVG